MINDEDFIFIDAGTSTALMIDYIGETNATFVTNGIAHAKRLLKKNLRTYMLDNETTENPFPKVL